MQELELDAKQKVDQNLKYWQSQNIKIEAGTKPTQAFINAYGDFFSKTLMVSVGANRLCLF